MTNVSTLNAGGGGVRGILLPHCGGGANSFVQMARQLPDDWTIQAVDPPGHGGKSGPLLTDFEDLLSFYRDELRPHLVPPYFLVGFSIGALAAFRIAQDLHGSRVAPFGLVAVASRPPHQQPERVCSWDVMSRTELMEELHELGGIPHELLNDREFMDYLLPILRADARICRTFRSTDDPPLQIPTRVLGGREDVEVSYREIARWKEVGPDVRVEMLDGPHMFFLAEESGFAPALAAAVEDIRPGRATTH